MGKKHGKRVHGYDAWMLRRRDKQGLQAKGLSLDQAPPAKRLRKGCHTHGAGSMLAMLTILAFSVVGCGGDGSDCCVEYVDQYGTLHECPDGTGDVPPGGR